MRNVDFRRGVLRCSSVALGLAAFFLLIPASARGGSNPDIPRMQAEAERGSIQQQVELGAAYLIGRGVPQDEKRAAYWYEKAANAGDPGAQMQTGYFYQAGIGVERDPAQAARWFQRAAAGGLICAKVNLGIAYLLGDGVRKDTSLAEGLFRQAYSQGNGLAAYQLGRMYSRGIGVKQDEAASERWYEAGAKLHDPRAEFQLASGLWHQGDSSDVKRAVKLLRESAATGMVVAKHELGVILLKRPELALSPKEAPTLLQEAAEAGEWRSSVALGLLSRDGMAGMPVDAKAAYYHYRLSVLQGGEEARPVVENDLEALSARLGPEQTAAIDANVREWFGGHHLAMVFINKDGGKWKDFPAFGVAVPQQGMYAGRLVLTDPLASPGGRAHRLEVR